MGDPDFLNRELSVRIKPAIVFLHSLAEMRKLTDRALLSVTGENKFQILAIVPYRSACAILDMESDLISAPSNADGYCLHFFLNTLYLPLRDLILRQPLTSLFIFKAPGIADLCCSFGNSPHVISLGRAHFIKESPVIMDNCPCYARVTMRSEQFREFIESFATIHDHTVSAVQLHITRDTIRWVTPLGVYDRSPEGCKIEGLEEGAVFKFGVRWNWPLFQMLCSASGGSSHAIVSVFHNSLGKKLYAFRFLPSAQTSTFTYMEQEFIPRQ